MIIQNSKYLLLFVIVTFIKFTEIITEETLQLPQKKKITMIQQQRRKKK